MVGGDRIVGRDRILVKESHGSMVERIKPHDR